MALLRLCLSYTTRSLRRGGQRTVLAVFCIAVGVMAVVSLRLAGDMVRSSLTSNVRDVLGGDVVVQSTAIPLTRDGLALVAGLERRGLVTGSVALGTERASVRRPDGRIAQLQLYVVDDPGSFPPVGPGTVDDPPGARIGDLLARPGALLVSPFAAGQVDAHAGTSLHLTLVRGGGGDLAVAGVLPNRINAGNPAYAYVSRATYERLALNPTQRYGIVDLLQPDAGLARQAADELRRDFPSATVQTVQDALDQNISTSTQVDRFLEIVGLLALLIGGIGIVNTMQVSLRRRRVEIAMLKCAGYRRRDLYALFGVEAGMLGLAGGVLGSLAGTAVSALVRVLISRAFLIDIAFHVDAGTVATGLLVGVVTALIFGLLPIVRAAAVRPAVVLRDSPGAMTAGSAAQTALLYALLVILFTGLAASLIGSLVTAVAVVAGAIVVIGLLTGLFALVVWLVGLVPVPERVTPRWVAGALVTVAVAVVATRPLHAIGAALLGVVLAAVGVVAAPRRVKTSVMLALRSLRRSRGRTATTIVALFIGIYSIGLILVLGQDISGKIDDTLSSLSGYSVFAIASPQDAATVTRVTATLPGLRQRRVTTDISTTPLAVDGRALGQATPPDPAAQREGGGQFRLGGAAGVEGFDLGGGEVPDPGTITAGRALDRTDAGSLDVLVRSDLANPPALAHLGGTITLEQPTSHRTVVVRIKGFYTPARIGAGGVRLRIFVQPILADRGVVAVLAGSGVDPDLQTTVALQLDPARKAQALRILEDAAPGVFILDIADIGAIVQQVLGNLVALLIALASLSVLAGTVIIANTVALAMLERRREMGILKAVGHSSGSVLTQVLVENAVVAAIGALAGMALVTVATSLLADHVLDTDLPVHAGVVLGCVGGLVALVVAVAALVAWSPTRIRPLEVLRYE